MRDVEKEQALRKEAVRRYLKGESVTAICRDLGRTERWLRKWIARRKTGKKNWFVEKSCAPYRIHNKIDRKQEKEIVAVRKQLMANPRAQIGCAAIQWRFVSEGKTPPGRSAIRRVLVQENLVRRVRRYEKKGVPYPSISARSPGVCFQMDIVGPRYVRGDGAFYAVNFIDAGSRQVAIEIVRRKNNEALIGAILATFRRMGIPRFLQMDNTMAFHGSTRHPRSLGVLLRFLLLLGVEPVFIPIQEPWRNGVIERFQNVFDKSFFRTQIFPSVKQLATEAAAFEQFHNTSHCYSALGGKPPCVYLREHPSKAKPFPDDFVPPEQLSLRKGKIHIVRFIRSDRQLDIFGERFTLSSDFEHAYVTATILVRAGQLRVVHAVDGSQITFDYALPKTLLPFPKS